MDKNLIKQFNHFKIHSQYSICQGAIKIDDLKHYCKINKVPAIGLSDSSNLCGALEFAENISKVGTQPIIGTQINFFFKENLGFLPLIDNNIDTVITLHHFTATIWFHELGAFEKKINNFFN